MKAIKSRTIWIIALMFITGGTEAITGMVPETVTTPLLFVLGLAASYFKLRPSQDY